jgi:hypothetical protein
MRLVGIGILLISLSSVIGYFVYRTISPGGGALVVEAEPQSIVYIDGSQVGRTPYETEITEGEIEIKLVPEGNVPLSPYNTLVKLTEGVKTIVRHKFGESAEQASGQIISFERNSNSETNIAIVTNPDGVAVFIDGENRGVSPVKTDVHPGNHTVRLSSPGFSESNFEVSAVSGYSLTAIVDLAKDNSKVETEESKEDLIEKIEILSTSVGFLRVRREASVNSEEIGQVSPGDTFEVLEYDEDDDWYKIEHEDGEEGWVSGQFAQTLEE